MPQPSRLQRLLIATDLSSRADRAFNRAVQLARANEARLTVLHVIPDELRPEFAEALKEQARKALEALVAQSMAAAGAFDVDIAIEGGLDQQKIMKQVAEGAERGDLSVEVRIEAGSIYDIINEVAEKSAADLVICGAHHKLMIGDEWLGSTMDRVLRFGSRPVLVVKTEPVGAYLEIVVAVDFSQASAEALEFAFTAFPRANFTLINAVESSLTGFLQGAEADQEALDRQSSELSKFSETALSRVKAAHGLADPNVRLEARPGSPTTVLSQYVTENPADLVVIGTHGRTGLRRAILGSVAEGVIASLPCDVLAVRPQNV